MTTRANFIERDLLAKVGMSETEKLPPLEAGILRAMQALDNQIAREINTRNPGERDAQGLQKWEPIERRVEMLTSFVLNTVGEQQAGLDSILVLSQMFTKALRFITEDLGEEGLGKTRSDYCRAALTQIQEDARRAGTVLIGGGAVN